MAPMLNIRKRGPRRLTPGTREKGKDKRGVDFLSLSLPLPLPLSLPRCDQVKAGQPMFRCIAVHRSVARTMCVVHVACTACALGVPVCRGWWQVQFSKCVQPVKMMWHQATDQVVHLPLLAGAGKLLTPARSWHASMETRRGALQADSLGTYRGGSRHGGADFTYSYYMHRPRRTSPQA
jgi:hypothetical protein